MTNFWNIMEKMMQIIEIIKWELHRRKTSIFWWSVGSIILSVVILTLYPPIRDQAAQMNQVINQLPVELRNLKAGGVNNVDVGNPEQFLNSQLFYATLPIIWIILAISRGNNIIGREENDHVLELLLARPISRVKLLLAKALSLISEMLLIGALTTIFIVIFCPIFDLHIANSRLILTSLMTLIFCLSFGYIVFVLNAISQISRKVAVSIGVIASFGGYILASFSSLTDWLSQLIKLFPFHYFSPLNILNGNISKGLVFYLLAVYIVGTVLAIIGFKSRDIN